MALDSVAFRRNRLPLPAARGEGGVRGIW